MRRQLLALTVVGALVALSPATAMAKSSQSSGNLKWCEANYTKVVGTTGPFASASACVDYLAGGGKTYPATPAMSVVISGPETGLGALVANPQSRVAGGITDPAMRFSVAGSQWVPTYPITLTYTAAAPLSYSYADPTTYFTPGLPTPGRNGAFAAFFQDNCFDLNNVLVSGDVPYTLNATNSRGQSVTKSGTLDCDAIPATLLATANTLAPTPGWIELTATGAHFAPATAITMTYNVIGASDGFATLNDYFSTPTTDGNGKFSWSSVSSSGPQGDNCYYTTGSGFGLQTTDMAFTMTASDGVHTASATGTLKCSLLAP